jgi:hypothetical protein
LANWSLEKQWHNRKLQQECIFGRYDTDIFDFRLFMSGKLKVKGNVMKGKIIQTHSQFVEADILSLATKMEPILAKAQTKAKL